jgi:hypothetical protein
MTPLIIARLHVAAKAASTLAKLAADQRQPGDDELIKKANAGVMALAKVAGAETAMSEQLLRRAIKGLGYGAGAAVPLGLVGSALVDRGAEQGHAEAEATRQLISDAAMGLGAAGLGMYMLENMNESPEIYQKSASHHDAAKLEFAEKLATIGAVDVILEDLKAHGDPARQKLAEEAQHINNAYLVQLFSELF